MLQVEICASTVAWISVVVVQALMHFFVLRARREARRERIRKETEAMIMEESLSYSEESVGSDFNTPNTPTVDPCFFTVSYSSSDGPHGNLKARLKAFPSEPYISNVSIDLSESYVTAKTRFDLSQTGTEMLKVC